LHTFLPKWFILVLSNVNQFQAGYIVIQCKARLLFYYTWLSCLTWIKADWDTEYILINTLSMIWHNQMPCRWNRKFNVLDDHAVNSFFVIGTHSLKKTSYIYNNVVELHFGKTRPHFKTVRHHIMIANHIMTVQHNNESCFQSVNLFVCFESHEHFSAIWRLSPLPLTGLQI
jgi:hypothetical protein